MPNHPLTIHDIGELWNCTYEFEFQCPKQWESLSPTESDGVRYCDECSQNVTLCQTPDEFVRRGNAGECVAVPSERAPYLLSMQQLGRPSIESVREFETQKKRTQEWWADVVARDPEFGKVAITEVAETITRWRQARVELPSEQLQSRGREAFEAGPDAFYAYLRAQSVAENSDEQDIYQAMKLAFDMPFRKFKKLVKRYEDRHGD